MFAFNIKIRRHILKYTKKKKRQKELGGAKVYSAPRLRLTKIAGYHSCCKCTEKAICKEEILML